MTKRYLSAALLLIFLFNVGGYFFYFKFLQYKLQKEIKQEIRSGLKEDELLLIIVPINEKNQITWVKKNKEFLYQGEMYDIIKTKNQNQKTYYYCINDLREKNLIANFNKNHNSKKEFEKKIRRVSISKYFLQPITLNNDICAFKLIYGTLNVHYKLNSIAPPSPPPKST